MKVKGDFELQCNHCGKKHSFSAKDADFDCIESNERQMGQENYYEWTTSFPCDCGKEIEIEYGVWEYPLGAFNYDEVNITVGKLVQKLDYEFY
jgi:hypothetical protein